MAAVLMCTRVFYVWRKGMFVTKTIIKYTGFRKYLLCTQGHLLRPSVDVGNGHITCSGHRV